MLWITGPLIGGELVPMIGFPDLMRTIGFVNLLFCPLIALLANCDRSSVNPTPHGTVGHYLSFSRNFRVRSFDSIIQPIGGEGEHYQRFHDELDSDWINYLWIFLIPSSQLSISVVQSVDIKYYMAIYMYNHVILTNKEKE